MSSHEIDAEFRKDYRPPQPIATSMVNERAGGTQARQHAYSGPDRFALKYSCTVCDRPILLNVHETIQRPCGHATHLACSMAFFQANRRHCSKCVDTYTPPILSAGNDVDIRASSMRALEYERNLVGKCPTSRRVRARQ